jgi:hypothetical protein
MHQKAVDWDAERGFDNRWEGSGPRWHDALPFPENRPCDFCGKPVDVGFIHDECSKKETDLWIDLGVFF